MDEKSYDGLVDLKQFLSYSRDCFSNGRGIPLTDPAPLTFALIKDKILLPVVTDAGRDFFSPHQLALLVRHMREPVGEGGLREAAKFRDTLAFLHRQKSVLFRTMQTIRHYNSSPTLDYDLSGVTEVALAEAGLSTADLTAQRALWGVVAEEIDPLISWRPFVSRIPHWRRDLLKGDGRLAQEVYDVADLIGTMLAAATGVEPEPLADIIHAGLPAPDGRVEYAHGGYGDPAAVRRAVGLARDWLAKDENRRFDVTDKKEWEAVDASLSESETHAAIAAPPDGSGADASDGDTGGEEKGVVPSEEYERVRKLAGKIDSVFGRDNSLMERVRKVIADEADRLERCLHDPSGCPKEWNAHDLFSRRNETLQDQRRLYVRLREIEEIAKAATMALCKRCRKNPVLLTGRNQSGIWSQENRLCRRCVDEMRDPTGEKLGEWRCGACDKVLQKFAHGEVLRGTTLNGNRMEVRLTYGEAIVEITCTGDRHKPCGRVNRRPVEFGWMPTLT